MKTIQLVVSVLALVFATGAFAETTPTTPATIVPIPAKVSQVKPMLLGSPEATYAVNLMKRLQLPEPARLENLKSATVAAKDQYNIALAEAKEVSHWYWFTPSLQKQNVANTSKLVALLQDEFTSGPPTGVTLAEMVQLSALASK